MKTKALKANSKISDEIEEEVVESSDNENLNLLVKRKCNKGNQMRCISKRNDSSNTSNSHVIIVESKDISRLNVLTLTKRSRSLVIGKRRKRVRKDVSTSHERSEEANLCLMVGYESSSSSQVSSLSSKDKNDYYQLLHDFEELHNEANKIVVMNNRLKGLNSWLENRVSQLESEIVDLKTDFEHLEIIYSNSIDCSKKYLATKPCENCTVLKNQVKYLLKTRAKFTRGKTNLEAILDSQNCVLGKAGLGYNLILEKKAKKFFSFFSKSESNDMSFISYNYFRR